MPLAPSLFCTTMQRIAVDMLGDVLGEQPAFDVGRAAGREVDQQRQPLALVERLVGARGETVATTIAMTTESARTMPFLLISPRAGARGSGQGSGDQVSGQRRLPMISPDP